MLATHTQHYLHKLESWTGSTFRPCALSELGWVLHLGHQGRPCPKTPQGQSPCPKTPQGQSPCTPSSSDFSLHTPALDVDAHDEDTHDDNDPFDWEEEDTHNLEHCLGPAPPKLTSKNLIIVHSTGVFIHQVSYCQCANAASKYMQLFQEGLFPASLKSPKTAFTFDCLEMFNVDLLECKTSASNYYAKLRRLTNPSFPHIVPVSEQHYNNEYQT